MRILSAILMVVTLCSAASGGQDETAIGGSALESLLDAIAEVESNGNPNAVGDNGKALGTYQIHRAYWKDGTRLLDVAWEYAHAKDPHKARMVVRAYLLHYGRGKSLLDMARIHNGGPRGHRKKATLRYARRVAALLDDEQSNS